MILSRSSPCTRDCFLCSSTWRGRARPASRLLLWGDPERCTRASSASAASYTLRTAKAVPLALPAPIRPRAPSLDHIYLIAPPHLLLDRLTHARPRCASTPVLRRSRECRLGLVQRGGRGRKMWLPRAGAATAPRSCSAGSSSAEPRGGGGSEQLAERPLAASGAPCAAPQPRPAPAHVGLAGAVLCARCPERLGRAPCRSICA